MITFPKIYFMILYSNIFFLPNIKSYYLSTYSLSDASGATIGAGTAYPSRTPEFTPSFKWNSFYSIFSWMCMFCRSLFVLLIISFGHCVVSPSSIYAFWLPLWYIQTLLITENNFRYNVTKFNVQYLLYLY